uniref:G-protein coupled receptors family 1 profile domain-containing protein n=1 Tax=Sciurus vulgaris TaxID=55149 RepID=A0A8D2D7A0_SCIVU
MEILENASWILEDSFKKNFNGSEGCLCGPWHSHLFLPLSVVYALIFVVGVVGNLLVCLLILRDQTMKTPQNYYLFSLAVCDLLVLLLGMPMEAYEMWSYSPFLLQHPGCYFKTALFETVCFASVLSITAVSVERYVGIFYPFRAQRKSTPRRARRILGLIWAFSLIFSVLSTIIYGIRVPHTLNETWVPGSATCAVIKPMWNYNFFIQFTSFLFYILPITLISVLYYLMGLRVSIQANRLGKSASGGLRWSLTLNKHIRLSGRGGHSEGLFHIVLFLAFAICWAPIHVHRLFFSFVEEWTESLAAVFNLIHVVSGVFFYLSSAIKPIIYSLLSSRFQESFQKVISPFFKRWHSQHHSRKPPIQQDILLTDCHLVKLTEDTGPHSCQSSTCNSYL